MPLTFPTSPTNGQTVTLSGTTYTYNATKGVWEATASGGGSGFDASAFDSHILPDTNETYDIGSASKKIRDLYLSDSTLNIGTQSISANSDGIVLPAVTIGTGTNKVILSATASGGLKQAGTNSAGVAAPESTGGGVGESAPGAAASYEDMAGLIAATGMTTGQTALVTSLNRLFMYTGTGWFKIADMSNASPTDITGVEGTYGLATDGTATTITAVSTDPEGFDLTWSYAVTTGSLGSTATVSQADNVFTITPSTDAANVGTFSITFSVTDGTTGAVNAVSAFTLAFSTTVIIPTVIGKNSSVGGSNTVAVTNNGVVEYTLGANAYTHQNGVIAFPNNDANNFTWPTGKKYIEIKFIGVSGGIGNYLMIGICDRVHGIADDGSSTNGVGYNTSYGATAKMAVIYFANGTGRGLGATSSGGDVPHNFGGALVHGDILGLATDTDNSKIYFSRNNTWSVITGDPGAGGAGQVLPFTNGYAFYLGSATASSGVATFHFGVEASRTYSLPTGYSWF